MHIVRIFTSKVTLYVSVCLNTYKWLEQKYVGGYNSKFEVASDNICCHISNSFIITLKELNACIRKSMFAPNNLIYLAGEFKL